MQALNQALPSNVAPVAIKMFMNITQNEWSLSETDARVLLGEPSRSTFYNWRNGKVSTLSRDTLERVSYIAGIYKALHLLLPQPDQANAWLKKPNAAFAGQSALDVMLAGSIVDLARVRRYLDAQRG
ncbi:MbcA/ParS/Xre antitoxin family protein [Rheinheimera sp.]|uniref:MbcA/ParS/Xre antitoxin family protein n=1 Tax=Rheinheimera sp. TaxID=1869214 RepID=UPI0040480C89